MELEKISKNLFKMFRNENTTAQNFCIKFKKLKEKVKDKEDIELFSGYQRELKNYIDRLYFANCLNKECTQKEFDDIREIEMGNLNRLQKLKNENSYKKDKHKNRHQSEDWG